MSAAHNRSPDPECPVIFTLDPDTISNTVTDYNNNNSSSSSNNSNNNDGTSSVDGSTKQLLPSKLPIKTKFFYSLGHIYNDLVIAIWFSYTLLFFQFQFSGALAGALILVGQVADAIASPFVGLQSDKSANIWLCARFGRRKTWHLLGVLMNTVSVPLVYNQCFRCEHSSQTVRFLYYSFLIVVFQAGWAFTQVTHVSLITDLTSDTNERIELNAYRQAATIGSNICLYAVTLFAIGFADNGTIQEKDLHIFTKVSYIVCGIGLVFALLFHIFVHEPAAPAARRTVKSSTYKRDTKRYLQQSRGSLGIITLLANTKDEPGGEGGGSFSSARPSLASLSYAQDPEQFERRLKTAKAQSKRWYHWLRSLSFWKITTMYTFARMFNNVTQVYTTLYLQRYLLLPKRMIAVIPFATYASGFVFSFALKPLSARYGSRVTACVGCAAGLLTGLCVYLGRDLDVYKTYLVFGMFALLGISGTALLVSTLSLTSDLIGGNTATGAFVFAAMSFVDKLINGIVIACLEQLKPAAKTSELMSSTVNVTTSTIITTSSTTTVPPVASESYYLFLMVALTVLPSALIAVGLATIVRTHYGRSHSSSSSSSSLATMSH